MSIKAKYIQYSLSVLVFLILSACATQNTLNVQQHVFQQWPQDAQGKSYRILNKENLEVSTYRDLLRQNMWKTGLYEAQQPNQATFEVDFDFKTSQERTLVQETYYDYYDPFYSPFWGVYPTFGYGSRHSFASVGMFYSPPRQTIRQVPYSSHELQVTIKDLRSKKQVYQSTVKADTSSTTYISQVMPRLVEAVFDGFPGNNGAVKTFQINLEQNQ